MTRSEQIEEILYEANAYGMREEVLQLANQLMIYQALKPMAAYERAFDRLITRHISSDVNYNQNHE